MKSRGSGDELWNEIKDKKWAWVQLTKTGDSSVNATSSFQRVDELQYARIVENKPNNAYSKMIDKNLTINNYTWVPDDRLTSTPPGLPSGTPWSTAETNRVDLI